MKNFEYAQPATEGEAVQLLAEHPETTQLLAGGTDLVGLMKKMIVSPERVVNVADIGSMRRIDQEPDGGIRIGASVRLDDFLNDALASSYPAVCQSIQGINSIQLQSQGTIAGELCRRPNCWYFRAGHGLLAEDGRMVVDGDNRFHAILGNQGPAKFVSASRLAPALISLGATVRVIGPSPENEEHLPLEQLYQIPRDGEQETTLLPGQLITHVILPPDNGRLSAAYEVRHGEGPDAPLAAAAATIEVIGGIVHAANIVMGHVAPIPWVSPEAAQSLVGHALTERAAELAGIEAVSGSTPLSDNQYKVQLAQVAVQRAILLAAGFETGGF